jgi:hypothetical protein
MKSKTFIKNTLSVAALAVAAVMSTSASAGLVFSVQESAVPGGQTPSNLVTADAVTGSYRERVDFSAGGGNFTATGFFNAGSYALNSASQTSFLLSPGAAGYKMYAVFRSDGFITGSGPTVFNGDPSKTNRIDIYVDPNSNTIASFQGATGTVTTAANSNTSNNSDDVLLASSAHLQQGRGQQNSSINQGDFRLVFDQFTLTAAGSAFFFDPTPFYTVLDLGGNFQGFALTGLVETSGSASATFVVPEPTTLALLGASLLGVGFSTRKKKLS